MKIAIAGKICSGKSYLSSEIIRHYPNNSFHKTSFAKKVKEIAVDLFDMKEKKRSLLINIAESMKNIDNNVWINAVFKEIEYLNNNIILDDLRFLNEFHKLKEQGWIIILVRECEEVRKNRIQNLYPDTANDHIDSMNSPTELGVSELDDKCFHVIIDSGNYNPLWEFLDKFLKFKVINNNVLEV